MINPFQSCPDYLVPVLSELVSVTTLKIEQNFSGLHRVVVFESFPANQHYPKPCLYVIINDLIFGDISF